MAVNFFDAAADLVSMGFSVFPIIPGGKRPLIKEWQKNHSDDAEQIAEWARLWPNANIAIACGVASGVMVIDVDNKEEPNGFDTLRRHKLAGRAFPPCPFAITPSGGYHMFYQYSDALRNVVGKTKSGRGIGPGVDFRSEGGYVVAAPSVLAESEEHAAGVYRWRIPPLSPEFPSLPKWAIELLKPREQARPKYTPRETTGDGALPLEHLAKYLATEAREGQRNNILYWAARTAIEEGAPPEAIRSRLTEAALACGLSPIEIPQTLNSAFKSGGAA